MLSQLLIVRLKAAENALRDGRLDEAYRLATAPDLRDHRRAGAVVAALTERFIERARAHFRADRFAEALIDLDRAEAGGVMKEELSELRAHVRTVQAEQQRNEQSRREPLDAAKRRIEGGSLAAGRRVLEQASEHDLAARHLRQQVNDRVDEVRSGLELAETLMAQGQWTAAADRVRRLKSIDAHDKKVARIETTLCKKVLDNARGALLDGRIGRAEDELACLGKLGDTLPSKREIRDMLSLARQAARGIQAHAYADARRDVMSLHRLLPKAGWVKKAIEQLRYLEDIRTELGAGPLGEISGLTTATHRALPLAIASTAAWIPKVAEEQATFRS